MAGSAESSLFQAQNSQTTYAQHNGKGKITIAKGNEIGLPPDSAIDDGERLPIRLIIVGAVSHEPVHESIDAHTHCARVDGNGFTEMMRVKFFANGQ